MYKNLVGKPEGKRPLGRPRCRGEHSIRKDLREKWGGKVWTGFSWLRIGTSGGCCEYGNEPSAYIKGGNILLLLSDLASQ
jgi:hypothetical protein